MGKVLIGMVHLPALPGAPGAELPMDDIERRAVNEARILQDAGFNGCILENFGDTPFYKDQVEPVTVAAMARVVSAECRAFPDWRVGVNVLRNDARAALSIASVCGARFVRVNVHVGATATDQGVVEGRAAETLRLRAMLGSAVEIWEYILPDDSKLVQDTGFQGFSLENVAILQPKNKLRGQALSDLDKHVNQWLASLRVRIEHAIGGVKRYRIVKDKIRCWKAGFKDAVFEACCGLHNFRLNFRPWHYQPIQLHLFVPF